MNHAQNLVTWPPLYYRGPLGPLHGSCWCADKRRGGSVTNCSETLLNFTVHFFSKELSDEEIKSIIDKMFSRTKGEVLYSLTHLGRRHALTHRLSSHILSGLTTGLVFLDLFKPAGRVEQGKVFPILIILPSVLSDFTIHSPHP